MVAAPSPAAGLRRALRLPGLVLAGWLVSVVACAPVLLGIVAATARVGANLPAGPLPAGDGALILLETLRPVTGILLAAAAWGLEVLCAVPEEYSSSLTALVMPAGHDADRLRNAIRNNARNTPAAAAVQKTNGNGVLENAALKLEIDLQSGNLKSIFDKRLGRELVAAGEQANKLWVYEDRPENWDAWNIGWTGTLYPTALRSVRIGERGPLRISLRVNRDVLGPTFKRDYPTETFPSSFFDQEIYLTAGGNLVEFKTDADWHESRTMLKVAFPVAVTDSAATYEIPYGWVRRSTRSPTRRWAW